MRSLREQSDGEQPGSRNGVSRTTGATRSCLTNAICVSSYLLILFNRITDCVNLLILPTQLQLDRRRLKLLRQAICGVGRALSASPLGAHWKRHTRLAFKCVIGIHQLSLSRVPSRLPNTTAQPAIKCQIPSVQQEPASTADAITRGTSPAPSLAGAIFLPLRSLPANELF